MGKLQSYAMSIALTKLKHGFITTKKGAKCLVIPIEENFLTEAGEGVYLQTDIVTLDEEDTRGNYGFQIQKLTPAKYKELGAEKSKELALPYLGNLKVFEKKTDKKQDVEINSEVTEDLPF